MCCNVLQVLQEPGTQAAIALAMGVSESTVSRLKNEHLQTLCTLLVHCGFKLVTLDASVVPRAKLEALMTLAKAHLESSSAAGFTEEQ